MLNRVRYADFRVRDGIKAGNSDIWLANTYSHCTLWCWTMALPQTQEGRIQIYDWSHLSCVWYADNVAVGNISTPKQGKSLVWRHSREESILEFTSTTVRRYPLGWMPLVCSAFPYQFIAPIHNFIVIATLGLTFFLVVHVASYLHPPSYVLFLLAHALFFTLFACTINSPTARR
jgi:hypothetical protein